MTDRSAGPRCGNNPNTRLTPGDRAAVDGFKARLALQAAAKPYIERAVWDDFDPLMEVIASTLWEHCARDSEDMPQLVCDDPRTIAAFAAAVARAHAASPAPATDQAAPSRRAGLRDEIVKALGRIKTIPPVAHRREQADHVLAVLYREWPWLRAEAEEAATDEDDRNGALIEEYLRFLRGLGPQPDLSALPPDRREAIAGQFEIVKALADRGSELPPLDRDPVARRLGLLPVPADRAAVCICGHTAQQHFEDACLVCDCGDYLPPAAAREVITRYQAAAKTAPADRAAVYAEVADRLAADAEQGAKEGLTRIYRRSAAKQVREWGEELRRLTAETPDTETQDAPPVEPHPTEVDLRHALGVLDRFHGRDTTAPTDEAQQPETGHAGGETPFVTQVWPLNRVLTEVRCGSQDWTWDEEWADLDRRHAQSGYLDKLAQDIRMNGITMPVLVGTDGRLWDGHHRLRVAVRLGIGYVPVEVPTVEQPAAVQQPKEA